MEEDRQPRRTTLASRDHANLIGIPFLKISTWRVIG